MTLDFKQKVIYQIYPKSFRDSDGDGIGDLRGIIEKIPYLHELGIDMIWLNPIFPSPQKDNGYDVSDYCKIDPLFGTMADFEELVSKLKAVNIDIMFDMVFNHTSTEHEWFQKALAGVPEYQDFYIRRPLKTDGSLPTNWESKFSGPVWAPFGETGDYYLHLFDPSQADLNWRHEPVRKKLYDVVNFWLDKGVKGFRFDVINLIGKDKELRDALPGENDKLLYTDRPIVHDYLHEMNQASFGQHDGIITVGEMSSTTVDQGILYSQPDRQELSMVFSFHHLKVDYENGEKWTDMPYDFMALKQILHEWQKGMNDGNGWNALFWNNHDQPRALNRFGDTGRYREKSAKMLAASMHLLRGTPYIYQGEEIGMINPEFDSLEDYQDVESHNAYQQLRDDGLSEEKALQMLRAKSRDNGRTPMQWNGGKHAGFSNEKPWLSVGKSAANIHVEQSLNEPDSVFYFYQKLIQLRKDYRVISHGSYEAYQLEHPEIMAYERTYESERLLVLNNYQDVEATITLPDDYLNDHTTWLIGNGTKRPLTKEMTLEPYETLTLYLA